MTSPPHATSAGLRGYNLLANVMAEHSDWAIYRRFLAGHHFDLMLQQVELIRLFNDLADCKIGDMLRADGPASTFDTIFEHLIESGEEDDSSEDTPQNSQWLKLMVVRQKLKEYSDHLLQLQSLLKLPDHNKDDLDAFQHWLRHEEGGNKFLDGAETRIWSSQTAYDLTSVNGHGSDLDPLSYLIEGRFLTWINNKGLCKLKDQHVTVVDPFLSVAQHQRMSSPPATSLGAVIPPDSPSTAPTTPAAPVSPASLPLPPSLSSSAPATPATVSTPTIRPFSLMQTRTRLDVYSSATIRTAVTILSTTLSSMLPTMSIFVLYFVKAQLVRLGLILVFTALFSAVVASVSKSRRAEGFAAAAAFAAVLVVFVSGNVDQDSGGYCCTASNSSSGNLARK